MTAHLDVMRQIIGTEWSPSDGPSQTINGWMQFIGSAFPPTAAYCASVSNSPYFSWCGATVGYCMAKCGIMPVFGSTDTTRFLWAMSWLGWGTTVSTPQSGDVVVFDFGGGDHHVTIFVADNGNGTWSCLGGNQSHAVKFSNFNKSSVMGIRRAPAVGAIQQPVTAAELQMGAIGPAVSQIQQALGVSVDGEFGVETDAAVRAFQASHGLDVDGVVGVDTFAALSKAPPGPVSAASITTLLPSLTNKIVALARGSALAQYSWPSRGRAPVGYINGLAVTFARVYAKLKAGDSAALTMTAPLGDPAKDALAWYGLTNGDRPTMLRQVFALLYGLGMRESSGNCYEGRDMSASNTSADTAEAGLFQQSWNSHTASPELPRLFAAYTANPDGFLSIFREGISGSPTANAGSGDGAAFQALCKSAPAFAAEAAGVGLRVLRSHWGPIIRKEAEIRSEASSLLQQVQNMVDTDISTVPVTQPGVPPVAQIDINAILAAIQPQLETLIQQAIAQAMANVAPPVGQPIGPAPSVVITAAPAAPIQVTMGSTIAHIQPVLDLFNNALGTFLPPPWNLIPTALGGVGHIIAAASGQTTATPASTGQAVNDVAVGILGALHAGGVNLPPFLTAVLGALNPATAPAQAAAPTTSATK